MLLIERACPPDKEVFDPAETPWRGSIWAYDLDSVVQIPRPPQRSRDDKPLPPFWQFRFSRVLQIVAKSPALHLDMLPAHATVVGPRPPWARCLAEWFARRALLRDPGGCTMQGARKELIVHDWLAAASNPNNFWQSYECRVWQFPSPRVPAGDFAFEINTMEMLHDFLTGAEMGSPYYQTFSQSLCQSGWELLCLTAADVGSDKWEDGSWLSSQARALWPFYEQMRREQKRFVAACDADAASAAPASPSESGAGEEDDSR